MVPSSFQLMAADSKQGMTATLLTPADAVTCDFQVVTVGTLEQEAPTF